MCPHISLFADGLGSLAPGFSCFVNFDVPDCLSCIFSQLLQFHHFEGIDLACAFLYAFIYDGKFACPYHIGSDVVNIEAFPLVDGQSLKPLFVLLLSLEDHDAIFVAVGAMSNFDPEASNIPNVKPFQTHYFDGLLLALLVLAKNDNILDLEAIDIALHFAALQLPNELHIYLLAHIAGLIVTNCPYFRMEGRVVTLVKLLVGLYPVAEVFVTQPGVLLVLIDIDAMLEVHLLGELLDKCAHVAVFYFEF